MEDQARDPEDDGLQNPVVHQGDEPDGLDTNERADESATIRQPSGEPVEEPEG